MNGVQLHLLLNHLPVLGIPFGLLLGAWALVRRSEDLLRTALGVLVLAALATGAAYLSGEPAEELVEHQADIAGALVERHEALAAAAALAASVLGIFALGVLAVSWWGRRQRVPRPLASLVLAGALAVAGILAYTAHLGGQIRHVEIRAGGALAAPGGVQADGPAPLREDDHD